MHAAIHKQTIIINGWENRPIAADIHYSELANQPVVIYAHGFNGFKDWGNFDLIAEQFAGAGFAFLKFNFSHNGTTVQQPTEFTDLEAFGNNNYSKQLYDLQQVIDWVFHQDNPYAALINTRAVFAIGHSMGGGILLLKAAEEKRLSGIATWAAIAQCKTPWGSWTEERMKQWKQDGVAYYVNTRTGQQMPLYYQLYLDYEQNKERLDILKATAELKMPLLVCHGTADAGVPIAAANAIHEAQASSELFIVESDHVFGRRHPNTDNEIPEPMQAVVNRTIAFFQQIADR